MIEEFKDYRLNELVPYESGYLADWPAETYQLSTADASLIARKKAYVLAQWLTRALTDVPFTDAEELTFSSAGITIESFKLILLPVWLASYHYRDQQYNVHINGQTGRIKGSVPRSNLRRWWDKFWGNE